MTLGCCATMDVACAQEKLIENRTIVPQYCTHSLALTSLSHLRLILIAVASSTSLLAQLHPEGRAALTPIGLIHLLLPR